MGSAVTIHPSITEEKTGINLTKESNMLQDQQPPLVEHLNAPSGDVKVVTVTTGSSQHSSYVQRSMPAVSPPLSNSVPTGMYSNLVDPLEVCV